MADVLPMTAAFKASDEVLEYLRSGDCIAIDEIIEQIDRAQEKMMMQILDFLSEFGLIEFNSTNTWIRITNLGEKFLKLPEV